MIYAIAGALLVGLSRGIFGSGGSILTVPVLIDLLHHPDKTAIAESLAIVGAIAGVSAVPYARAGLVEWRTAFVFGLPGMAGTYLGAWLAAFVPGSVQLFVFAGVMLLAAAQMWKRSRSRQSPPQADGASGEPHPGAPRRSFVKIGVEGLAVEEIAEEVGAKHGLEIGRTSFRLRNTDNTPPVWAELLVDDRVAEPVLLADRSGRLGAFSPIELASFCTRCHGEPDKLAPGVSGMLAELYPDDRATGFAEGDLRG